MVKHINERYKNERYKKNILDLYTDMSSDKHEDYNFEHFKIDPIKDIEKASKKAGKDIKKADPLKDLEKFFKDIDTFFKKVKEAFTFTQKKMIAVLLTTVIPFFGQIIGRILYLNGSLDKPWLLLFGIPPLTLIPALFMMFGLIKKGKGGNPWDYYILIPIIINIILTFVYSNGGIKGQIIRYVLLLLSFIFIYWLRSKKLCKNKSARFTKILTDSLITYILIEVMKIVLEYVPFIGIMIKVINKTIPFGYLILDAFSIFCVYVITNMINGSSSKFCKTTTKNKYIGILILISIMITYKNYLSLKKPNNNVDTNNNVIDKNNNVIDKNNTVIDTNNTVIDTNNNVIDKNINVIDTNNNVIDTNNTVIDTNNTVIDTNNTINKNINIEKNS